MTTAKEIFEKFKSLHPNNGELYDPTAANLSRWRWHIDNVPAQPEFERYEYNEPPEMSYIKTITQRRRFTSFDMMPDYMILKYLTIAALFPGVQLCACGSRVKGEYIDDISTALHNPNFEIWSPVIVWMRRMLRKTPKENSDYDFLFEKLPTGINFEQVRKKLPEWADVFVHDLPESEKIQIPMGWDFERLPVSEHQKVADLYFAGNWGALMQIHNEYQLSPTVICCNKKPVILWFRWAIIEAKIIQYVSDAKQ